MSRTFGGRLTPLGAIGIVAGVAFLVAAALFIGTLLPGNPAPTQGQPTPTEAPPATDTPQSTGTPAPTDVPSPTPTIEISPIPPEGLTYKVQEGDTLWDLCVLFYGEYTEERAQRIIDANAAKHPQISPDGALYAGWILTMPPDDPDATLVPLPTSTPTAGLTPVPTGGASYKVQAGDTLWDICVRFYGRYTEALGQKIIDANVAEHPAISPDGTLYVGWVLTIPPE